MTIELIDSRKAFIESWLVLNEMPMGIDDSQIYNILLRAVEDRIEFGSKIIDCGNNLYKISGNTVEYYWMGNYDIIAELEIKSQTTMINSVAKKTPGGKPYASDFYIAILNDISDGSRQSLLFTSDTKLTRSGLEIWKRLLNSGYVITIYDREKPGSSMISVQSEEELLQYFKMHDIKYQKYQFVLSKPGIHLGEVRGYFNTRRLRELSGSL